MPRATKPPLVTAELVRMLVDELPQRLSELEQKLDEQDLAILASAVHAAQCHGPGSACALPDAAGSELQLATLEQADLPRLRRLLGELARLYPGIDAAKS